MEAMNKNTKETIIIEKNDNGISKIILNQPEKHNALSPTMIKELSDGFDELKADPNTKVLIISAKGKSFCAGGDLDWMKEQIFSNRKTRIEEARKLADLLYKMYQFPKPLIASNWLPEVTILYGNSRTSTNVQLYINSCDLVIHYTDVELPWGKQDIEKI